MKKFLDLLMVLLVVLLTACTSTGEVVSVVPTQTEAGTLAPTATLLTEPTAVEVTATAEATATALPTATETAVSLESAPPTPPRPAADGVTFAADGYLAFVQDRVLYIQDLAQTNPPVMIDSCVEVEFCGHNFLKWSPDGQYLLYYHTEDFELNEIRLATPQGERLTIGTAAHFIHPAAWSPDGRSVVYLRDTVETKEIEFVDEVSGTTVTIPAPLMEVVTVSLTEGAAGTPQVNGTLTLSPPGCGGGGRSPAAVLYENEGGTAYGYTMGVLEWTTPDVLLFTLNCTNVGIGRYDMAAGTQLEPLDSLVRNLVLSPDKSRWFAVSGNTWASEPGNNGLVTGDPATTAVTPITTSNPVEMVFSGQRSGRLYFTSRHILAEDIIDESVSGLGFRFYETTLWQIEADGQGEIVLYQAEDQAFAGVQEAPGETLLFVRIENDRPLYEAMQAEVPSDRWPDYEPKRHIVTLDDTGSLHYLLPDAGSPAVTP